MSDQLITRKQLATFEHRFKVELNRLRDHHDAQFRALNDRILKLARNQQNLEDLQPQIHEIRTFIHDKLNPAIKLCTETGRAIQALLKERIRQQIANDPDQTNHP